MFTPEFHIFLCTRALTELPSFHHFALRFHAVLTHCALSQKCPEGRTCQAVFPCVTFIDSENCLKLLNGKHTSEKQLDQPHFE